MHAIYSHTENTYIHTYIHKNETKHSEMGPVRENSIQRPVRSVYVCALHCARTIVTHNIAQNRPDNFQSYPPDSARRFNKRCTVCNFIVVLKTLHVSRLLLLTGQLTRLKIHPPSGVARIWCDEGAQNYTKLFIAHKMTRNNT